MCSETHMRIYLFEENKHNSRQATLKAFCALVSSSLTYMLLGQSKSPR